MKTLAHIAAKLVDTPLLIHPPKLDAILAAIGPRVGIELPIEAQAQLAPAERHAYDVTEDGIAVIPVQGTLMKKAYGLWAMSGSDSYELLAEQIQRAAEDSSIQGVLLDIDSPGGETHGCFELADLIHSLRGAKPIYAIANDSALSAAYAIASSADKVFVDRKSVV